MHSIYVADMKSRRQDFISGVRVKDIRPLEILCSFAQISYIYSLSTSGIVTAKSTCHRHLS